MCMDENLNFYEVVLYLYIICKLVVIMYQVQQISQTDTLIPVKLHDIYSIYVMCCYLVNNHNIDEFNLYR